VTPRRFADRYRFEVACFVNTQVTFPSLMVEAARSSETLMHGVIAHKKAVKTGIILLDVINRPTLAIEYCFTDTLIKAK